MDELFIMLLKICPLVFIAGLIDAIAGGGGLISLPAYLFAGLPPHIAMGTNKFAMSFGTAIASANFIKAKKVNYSVALYSVIGAIIGSAIGSRIAVNLSAEAFNLLLACLLPIAGVIMLLKDKIKLTHKNPEKVISKAAFNIKAVVIGLLIGMYDGIAGPGTGTFLIIAFTCVLNLDYITSSGCSKVSNLASNISALVIYLLNGKILFAVGIPAAVCAIAGGYIGSKMAIKGGEKIVKRIIILVLVLIVIKLLLPIFS